MNENGENEKKNEKAGVDIIHGNKHDTKQKRGTNGAHNNDERSKRSEIDWLGYRCQVGALAKLDRRCLFRWRHLANSSVRL